MSAIEAVLNEIMAVPKSAPAITRAVLPVGEARRTAIVPEIRSIDEKARTIDFVASTETVDRYGDIIRTKGWKLDSYKANPVFLWAHNSQEPPIGRTVDIHIASNPPALIQRVEFADAKTYPFADTIFQLYQKGFMKAVSVGFRPLERPKMVEDAKGDWTGGYEFTSQELLELSAVPIPANPEAVARAAGGIPGVAAEDMERLFVHTREKATVSREEIDEVFFKLRLWELKLELGRLDAAIVRHQLLRIASEVEPAGEKKITTVEELVIALKSGK